MNLQFNFKKHQSLGGLFKAFDSSSLEIFYSYKTIKNRLKLNKNDLWEYHWSRCFEFHG